MPVEGQGVRPSSRASPHEFIGFSLIKLKNMLLLIKSAYFYHYKKPNFVLKGYNDGEEKKNQHIFNFGASCRTLINSGVIAIG